MQIKAPFGYGAITPLDKQHKVLLSHLSASGHGSAPLFVRGLNAIALSFSEFAPALHDYPIVFSSVDDGVTYAPLAVLGLADGENLFVDAAGNWAADHYVPAFVRRYPFCLSRVYIDGIEQNEKLVCVDRAYIDESGVALFGPDGVPTAYWIEREQLIAQYESDMELTEQMCAGFRKLELFEPFSMQVLAGARGPLELKGMFRINEAKFLALKPASHKALATKGWAARIYAHLFSLANFALLHQRSEARAVQQQAVRLARA